MDKKDSPHSEQTIVARVKAEMKEPRLTESVRQGFDNDIDSGVTDPETVRAQIARLRQSLAENERSWKATGLISLKNPVATSIRWDIEEKEKLLGLTTL